MALSPEDVIKKSFSATHLRRGYDETQVDDFLDEVVIELRRLHAESDGLRTDLADCRAGRGEGGEDTGSFRPAIQAEPSVQDTVDDRSQVDDGSQEELAELRRQLAECQEARARAEARAKEAEERAARAADAASTGGDEATTAELAGLREQHSATDVQSVQEAGATQGGADPNSIISLAQRVHDQHVAEGESTRAQLIDEGESTKERLIEEGDTYRSQVVAEADERSAELRRTGQETHDRLVEEGETTHGELIRTGEQTRDELIHEGQTTRDQMIGEAEQQRATVLEDLRQKQTALGSTIQGLITQEKELRERLRIFLQDQMQRLDGSRTDR